MALPPLPEGFELVRHTARPRSLLAPAIPPPPDGFELMPAQTPSPMAPAPEHRRGVMRALKDLGGSFVTGAAEVPLAGAQVLESVSRRLGIKPAEEFFQAGKEYWQGEAKRREETMISEAGRSPDQSFAGKVSSSIARSVPGLISAVVPGAGVTKAAKLLGAGRKVATWIGVLTGGSLAEGVQAGGLNAAQTGETIRTMPDTDLAKLPGFQEVFTKTKATASRGQRFSEAREALAKDAEDFVGLTTGLTTAAGSLVMGGGLEGALLRGVSKATLRAVLTNIATEGGEELLQTAPEVVIQNYVTGRPLSEGLRENLAVAGAAGAVMGGTVAGAASIATRVDEARAKAIADEMTKAASERLRGNLTAINEEIATAQAGGAAEEDLQDLIAERDDLQVAVERLDGEPDDGTAPIVPVEPTPQDPSGGGTEAQPDTPILQAIEDIRAESGLSPLDEADRERVVQAEQGLAPALTLQEQEALSTKQYEQSASVPVAEPVAQTATPSPVQAVIDGPGSAADQANDAILEAAAAGEVVAQPEAAAITTTSPTLALMGDFSQYNAQTQKHAAELATVIDRIEATRAEVGLPPLPENVKANLVDRQRRVALGDPNALPVGQQEETRWSTDATRKTARAATAGKPLDVKKPQTTNEAKTGPRYGTASTMFLPSGAEIPVQYELVEDGEITRAKENDRDYTSAEELARNEARIQAFKPALIVHNNPTADTGPSIVDQAGEIQGGNRRDILISDDRTYPAYREYLKANAAQFGLDPAQVDAMKRPKLIRRLLLADKTDLNRRLNDAAVGDISMEDNAISAARMLNDEVHTAAGSLFEAAKDEAPLTTLKSAGARDLSRAMLKAGIIRPNEKSKYLVPNKGFTDEGARLARYVMLASVAPDKKVLAAMADTSLESKILNALPAIARAQARGVDISPIFEAIRMELDRAALKTKTELPVEKYQAQLGLNLEGGYSPEAFRVQRILANTPATRARKVFNALSTTVAPVANGEASLTGETNRKNIGQVSDSEIAAILLGRVQRDPEGVAEPASKPVAKQAEPAYEAPREPEPVQPVQKPVARREDGTDGRTGIPTFIGGRTVTAEERATGASENRRRNSAIVQIQDETRRGGPGAVGSGSTALESAAGRLGLPVVKLASLGLTLNPDGTISTADLTAAKPGAEATPYLDEANGVVYKLFQLDERGNLGVTLKAVKTADGWTVEKAPATLGETLDKLATLHEVGALPTEIVGITNAWDLVVKQPMADAYAAGGPAERAGAVGAIKGIVVAAEAGLGDMRIFWDGKQAWFIGDLHPGNVMKGADGQPSIIDAILGKVPAEMLADVPAVAKAVEQAWAKYEGREDGQGDLFAPATKPVESAIPTAAEAEIATEKENIAMAIQRAKASPSGEFEGVSLEQLEAARDLLNKSPAQYFLTEARRLDREAVRVGTETDGGKQATAVADRYREILDLITGKLPEPPPSNNDTVARELYGKPYAELDEGEQNSVDLESDARERGQGDESQRAAPLDRALTHIATLPENQRRYAERYARWVEGGRKGAAPGGILTQSATRSIKTAIDGFFGGEGAAPLASASAGKIDDFGEKIGGARKDTADRGFTMGGKKATDDDAPAWRKRFVAAESVHTPGQWSIIDTKDKWGLSSRRGQTFPSKEAAEEAIPLYAVAKNHSVYSNQDGSFSIYKDVGPRKRLKIVAQTFPSREDAMKYMATHAVDILNMRTSFGEEILPVPDLATRKGAQRRTTDATPEMFMETFAPRGIEFGNWNNQEERQLVMNHAYDGLMDLAEVMGVPPKALMLNGELAIAFGSRGQGLVGAKAHYERDYGVINLTKMKGAGSLAHEWMHALDHYLARVDTKASSEKEVNSRGDMVYKATNRLHDLQSHGPSYKSKLRVELRDKFNGLVKALFRKGEQYVEDTAVADKFLAKAREQLQKALTDVRQSLERDNSTYVKGKFGKPASAEQLAEFDRLASILVEGGSLETKYIPNKNKAFSGRYSNDVVESISNIYKAARNRSGFSKEGHGLLNGVVASMRIYSERLKLLNDAATGREKTKQVATNFAIEAKKMDQARSGDYWSEPHEMLARAFSAYVEDRIAESGGQSDFLVYHAHGGILLPMIDGFVARPYPEGAERAEINKLFDAFVKEIKTRETPQGVAIFAAVPGVANPWASFESPGAGPMTVDAVKKATAQLARRLGKTVSVINTIADLSPADQASIGSAMRSQGVTGARGIFMPDGRIILVASNLTSREQAIATLLHEITERGLAALPKASTDMLLEDIFRGRMDRSKVYQAARERVTANYPNLANDLDTAEGRIAFTREVIAHIAENRTAMPSLWQRLIRAFRRMLATLTRGMPIGRLFESSTDEAIEGLIDAALNAGVDNNPNIAASSVSMAGNTGDRQPSDSSATPPDGPTSADETPLIGKRLPDEWVYHNIPASDIAIIEREGLSAGSFTVRPGFDFGRDSWIAVRESDLRNVQRHNYGGVETLEPQWEPGRLDNTYHVVPANRVVVVSKSGIVRKLLGTPSFNSPRPSDGPQFAASDAPPPKPQGSGWKWYAEGAAIPQGTEIHIDPSGKFAKGTWARDLGQKDLDAALGPSPDWPTTLLDETEKRTRQRRFRAAKPSQMTITIRNAIRLAFANRARALKYNSERARRNYMEFQSEMLTYLREELATKPANPEKVIARALSQLVGREEYQNLKTAVRDSAPEVVTELEKFLSEELMSYYGKRLVWMLGKKDYVEAKLHPEVRDRFRQLVATTPYERIIALRDELERLRFFKSDKVEKSPAEIEKQQDKVDEGMQKVADSLASAGNWQAIKAWHDTAAEIWASSQNLQFMTRKGMRMERSNLAAGIRAEIESSAPILSGTEDIRGRRTRGFTEGRLTDLRLNQTTRAEQLGGGNPNSLTAQVLGKDIQDAETKQMTLERQLIEAWKRKQVELGIKEDDWIEWSADLKEYTLNGQKIKLTTAEIMDLFATMQDPENIAELARAPIKLRRLNGLPVGITFGKDDDAEGILAAFTQKHLTPQQRGIMKHMVKALTDMGEAGNEVSRALYGQDLFTKTVYWPRERDITDRTPQAIADIDELRRDRPRMLEHLGLTKARVANRHGLMLSNVAIKFAEHVHKMSAYTHLTIPIGDALATLQDFGVSSSIRQRYGSQYIATMRDLLERVAGLRRYSDAWTGMQKTLAKIERNAAVAILWGRISTILFNRIGGSMLAMSELEQRHPGKGLNYLRYVGAPSRLFWYNAANKAAREKLMENGYLWKRWSHDFVQVQANLPIDEVEAVSSKTRMVLRKVQEFGMRPMAEAEMKNAVATFRVLVASGMSEAQAVHEAEDIVRSTQNPSSPMQETLIYEQLKKSGLGIVFPFMGQPTVAANLLARDINRLRGAMKAGRSTKGRVRSLALTAVGLSASVAMTAAIRAAIRAATKGEWPDDEEERNRTILQATNEALDLLMPGAGKALDTAMSLRNRGLARDTSIIGKIVEAFSGFARDASAMAEDGIERGRLERCLDRLATAVSMTFGLPYSGPMQTVKAAAGLAGEPFADVDGDNRPRKIRLAP